MTIVILLVVPLVLALIYVRRKSGSRKTTKLQHHLLASGSILQRIRRH